MLVSLVRACRRGAAGIAWLIDYAVAVLFSAWDGVSVSRSSTTLERSPEPIIDFAGAQAPPARVFTRPGRAAASLALFGVLGISLVGAVWGQQASNAAPGAVTTTITSLPAAAAATETSVLLWAPLVDEPSDETVTALEATAPETAEATADEADAEATLPDPAPVSAAAAETPTPEPTPEPASPTPTPTPEPPPPPPPPAPALTGQLTKAQVRELALAAGWPEAELDELVSVAWCESRFRVEANGWGALGLMQIMPFWFESLGIDVALALDPVTNLKVAYHIYQNDLKNGYGEWASWTCKPVATS